MKCSKFNLLVKADSGKTILFNTLSGETFLIDEVLSNKFNNKEISAFTDNELKEFIDKKIIIDDNVDENKLYNYYRNKAIYQNNNLTYTVLLTWACNLRCVYCYEGAGDVKNNSMTRETANNLIKHIENEATLRNSKTVSIMLFGGEPLVNFKEGKHILENLSKYCKENNVLLTTSIVTNGTLLTEEIIKDLIKYNCKYIQVTLDGTKDIHDTRRIRKNGKGTFDEIIEKLHLLKKFKDKYHVVLRVNIDKTNYKRVPELLTFLKKEKLDVFSIDFGIVRGSTESCNDYEDNCIADNDLGTVMSDLWALDSSVSSNLVSYPMRKWTYCGLDCDNNYTIEPTGEVYKCWEHVGNKKHLMGKISEEGKIIDINPRFYDWMTQTPTNNSVCGECVYLPACGGGCRSISFDKGENFHSSQCFKVKGVLEEELKVLFKEKIN